MKRKIYRKLEISWRIISDTYSYYLLFSYIQQEYMSIQHYESLPKAIQRIPVMFYIRGMVSTFIVEDIQIPVRLSIHGTENISIKVAMPIRAISFTYGMASTSIVAAILTRARFSTHGMVRISIKAAIPIRARSSMCMMENTSTRADIAIRVI